LCVCYLCCQLNPDVVHELEIGVPHSISLTPTGDVTMTVTLIDANHCPGSVMFLFDGYFGRILYTGDFRYSEAMLTSGGLLGDLVTNPIDVLYLDNTFCSPKCAFPPHEEALKSIIAIIEHHPNDRVMFGMRSLGKEDMLIAISECFNEKIAISLERYKVLQLLGLHERFVVCGGSKEAKPRFEVVSLVEVTRSNVDAWNKSSSTIAILPTALFEGLGFQPFVSSSDIFVVPYSDHSPFAELHQFVSGIRPKSVIPIVRADVSARDDPLAESLLDRANVECFADCLDRTPMQNYHIPASVLEMMNQNVAGDGQAKKRAARNGNRRQKCKQNVSRMHIGTTKLEQKSLLRKLSVSSDNLESCLSAAADIAGVTDEQTATVELELSQSSMSTNVAPVPRATHVLKPHVLVRPMKRCSSSDRLLALAMRPSSYMLKQRLGRMSASASGFAQHSSIPLPQSCVRPKSTVVSVSPVLSLIRGRRDRPQVMQHRVSRYQGTAVGTETSTSAQHSIELNHGEESKFVYTDRVLAPSERSSQVEMTDAPLNLSQSAMLQVPVNTDGYLPADPSNSSLEQHVTCDYSQYQVCEQMVCSTSNVASSNDLYNLDSAAIAVSSLLSLSNGDVQTPQFSYLPTHLGVQNENTQDEIAMSNGVTWQSSMATETIQKDSSGSVDDVASECITNFVSLASAQKSPPQDHAIDLHMECAELKSNGNDRAEVTRYKESGKLVAEFQQLHQIINITDVSADEGLTSFAGLQDPGLLPLQAMVHANLNSPSSLLQQRLPVFVDKGTSHYSESMSNDEPHDYSMTPTAVTDSFSIKSQQLLSSDANEQLICSASCCTSLQTACVQDQSDSVVTNWTDARFESTTSVDDSSFLHASSTVMFDRDVLSNSSDSMSFATRESAEVCLSRLEPSDSNGENFSAAVSTTGMMLPPKKNWRRRYHRSSQLNRAHQENKRFPGYMAADSDKTEGCRSPAIKRPLSRGRSDALFNPGLSTDGKSILTSEEVGLDCESNRPSKRPPLVASHSFHHLSFDSRLQAVEKSVLKSNPANMRRHITTDDSTRQTGCLPSTGLLDSDVKRVTRSMWEGRISKPTIQPALSVKQPTSVVEYVKLPNGISTVGVASSLPLDLSAYQNIPLDSSIDHSRDCRDKIVR